MPKRKTSILITASDMFVIIDGQNDFTELNGALYVQGVTGEPNTDDIILSIRVLARKNFGYIATTEDKHPLGHVEEAIFGAHCIEDTPGQKYHHDLKEIYRSANERLVKGENPAIISYSVCTSPQFPKHIAKLRKLGIKRVILAGWAFTHCVGESAIAYAAQGFETYVVRDATASVPPPYGNLKSMLLKLKLYGVKLINYKDIT